jgi:hypothetical protein
VLDGAAQGMARIATPAGRSRTRDAPGVPAMLLRIRLAAAQAAGLSDVACDTARQLLADGRTGMGRLANAALKG